MIGAATIIIAVNWTSSKPYQAFAVGLMLTVNIILLGPVSNAHCNPAVTLGVFIRNSVQSRSKGHNMFNFVYALKLMGSQIIGAIIGATIVGITADVEGDKLAKLCTYYGSATCETESPAKALLVEVVGTFVFVSVNVKIIFDNGSKELILNAFVIGIALAVGVAIAAPLSGGSINPAVGLVQPIFQNIMNDTISLNQMWIHIVGPFIGALLAGFFQISNLQSMNTLKDLAHEEENIVAMNLKSNIGE
jgi:aquaporin Z